MERSKRADHPRAGVIVEPTPTGFHDALVRRQQGLGRGIAERDQHIRVHQLDLPLDERQADLRLLRRRRAVARRPPWNDIGDVGAGAVEPDRRYHPVQQLAGTADERSPSMSSSRPGASPTNMMRACGLPSANTSRVAVDFSAQPSKFSSRARSTSSEGAVRAASRAETIAASGAGVVSPRATGIVAGIVLTGLGSAVSRDPEMGIMSGSDSRLTGSSVSAQSTPASR